MPGKVKDDFPERIARQQLWNGDPLPAGLLARLLCDYQRFHLVQQQIKVLEAERRETIRSSTPPEAEQVRRLPRLRGIGINCA